MTLSIRPSRLDRDCLPYRDGVGMVLFNDRMEVWLGCRRPRWIAPGERPVWQMPQGGLEAREPPFTAAVRELNEETGAKSFTPVAVLDTWLTYDLPDHMLGVALKGRYRGQRHLWFAFHFTGDDSEFDVRGSNTAKPEFQSWQWARPDDAIDRVVPWKQDVYKSVFAAFAGVSGPA